MSQYWDFRKILDVYPDRIGFTCVGTAKLTGVRCKISSSWFSRADIAEAARILDEMGRYKKLSSSYDYLEQLAGLTLCPRWHRKVDYSQVDDMCRKWTLMIKEHGEMIKRQKRTAEIEIVKEELMRLKKEQKISASSQASKPKKVPSYGVYKDPVKYEDSDTNSDISVTEYPMKSKTTTSSSFLDTSNAPEPTRKPLASVTRQTKITDFTSVQKSSALSKSEAPVSNVFVFASSTNASAPLRTFRGRPKVYKFESQSTKPQENEAPGVVIKKETDFKATLPTLPTKDIAVKVEDGYFTGSKTFENLPSLKKGEMKEESALSSSKKLETSESDSSRHGTSISTTSTSAQNIKTVPITLKEPVISAPVPEPLPELPRTPIRRKAEATFGNAVINPPSNVSKTHLPSQQRYGLMTPPETPEAADDLLDIHSNPAEYNFSSQTPIGQPDFSAFSAAVRNNRQSPVPTPKPESRHEVENEPVVETCAACGAQCEGGNGGRACEEKVRTSCLKSLGLGRLGKKIAGLRRRVRGGSKDS